MDIDESDDVTLLIRALVPEHAAAAEQLLDAEVGGRVQARLGETVDVLALPGFGAWLDDQLVGAATYDPARDRDRAELAVIAVVRDRRLRGVGSALLEAVADAVTAAGGSELWLVTTNDNVDALRLYQRRGFRLSRLELDGMGRARELKPTIPLIGQHGIPMRDELVLVRPLP